jgi:hypothetical protein
MQVRQKQVIDMIGRVQSFLIAHTAIEPSSYAVAKRVLDEIVKQLRDFAAAQIAGVSLNQAQFVKAERAAKRLIDGHIRPIVAIAQGLAKEGEPVPRLKLPPSDAAFTRLKTYADGLATSLQGYEAAFVADGCPEDFIAQMRGAIAELDAAVGGHDVQKGTKIGATKGLQVQLRKARSTVKRLDAVVRMAYSGNEVVLEKWRFAKRVVAARTTPADTATPDIAPEKTAA